MLDNIMTKRIDNLGGTQHGVQVREVALARIDSLGVGLLGELLVLVVDLGEDTLVEFECDHTALVKHGARGIVLHSLRHVVDVDIVAEHLAGRAVLRRDGRAGEPDERRVRQGAADEQRGARVLLAVSVELLFEPVLPAVRLIDHHHDVLAVGERGGFLLELLHRGEDDAVGAAARDLLCKIGSALCLHGRLAQKVRAFGELREQLRVEVVAVGDHHDGGAVELLFEKMSQKHHRERLARALRVPENAALAVAADSLVHALESLVHREVLMVASEDFLVL